MSDPLRKEATMSSVKSATEAFEAGVAKVVGEKFYSESQERGDNGRWTAVGSTEGMKAESARSAGEHRAAAKYHSDAAAYHKANGNAVAASAHIVAARAHEEAARSTREKGPANEDTRHAREASGDAHIASLNALMGKHSADDSTAQKLAARAWNSSDGHAAETARTHAEHVAAVAYHETRAQEARPGPLNAENVLAGKLHVDAAMAHGLAASMDVDGEAAREASRRAHIATGERQGFVAKATDAVLSGINQRLAAAPASPTKGKKPVTAATAKPAAPAAKPAATASPAPAAAAIPQRPPRVVAGPPAVGQPIARKVPPPPPKPKVGTKGDAEEWDKISKQVKFYSEGQPRDDRGRWGGGSGKGKAAEKAKTTTQHEAAIKYHTAAAKALNSKHGHTDSVIAHRNAAGNHRAAISAKRWADSANAGARARQASREAHGTTAARNANFQKAYSADEIATQALAAVERGAEERFYSESQERDNHGRWTGVGSSEGVRAEHASLRSEHAREASARAYALHDKFRSTVAERTDAMTAARNREKGILSPPNFARSRPFATEVTDLVKQAFYSDLQERDDHGKWTSSGTTGGSRENALEGRGEDAHVAAGSHHMGLTGSPELVSARQAPDKAVRDAGRRVEQAHLNAAEAHDEASRTNTKSDGKYAREASKRAYELHDKFRESNKSAAAVHARTRSLERPFPKK